MAYSFQKIEYPLFIKLTLCLLTVDNFVNNCPDRLLTPRPGAVSDAECTVSKSLLLLN